MLEVTNLHFDYHDQPLLSEVSFSLPAGGLLHLRGANGAGKTTLLKLMAGLYRPLEGDVRFSGLSIYANLAAYQRQICFVGHKTGINPNLTLRENCFFDLQCSEAYSEVIDELAVVFKLEHYLDFPCGLLSAGQKRQVGLLRLWMSQAKLWLLDEPLVALDDMALELVMQKIAKHRKQGGLVLLTSHQQLPLDCADYKEYRL